MIAGLVLGLLMGAALGFIAGLIWFAKHLPQIMSSWTPDQLTDLAHRVAKNRS